MEEAEKATKHLHDLAKMAAQKTKLRLQEQNLQNKAEK
jgi:hypothetical protein